MSTYALLGVTVLIAALVQGATGLGFALISGPVVGIVSPRLLPVFLLVQMIPLNGYVAWRERHALDGAGTTWISVGRFVGTFGGLGVLAVSDSIGRDQLRTAFLLLPAVLVGALLSRLVHHRLDGRMMRYLVLGFALVSGIVVTVRAL